MKTKERNKTYNSADYKALTDPERTVFRNMVDTLTERGIFNPSDVPVIAAYARNVVLARTAARDVQRLGTVIEFKDRGFTKYKTNPAVDIMNKAQAAYEATAIKLGLTPTGRKRLKSEEPPPKSELDKFLERLTPANRPQDGSGSGSAMQRAPTQEEAGPPEGTEDGDGQGTP
jgi:P27 family predicted phage terminase small subunit